MFFDVHLGDSDIQVTHRAALGEAYLYGTEIHHIHLLLGHGNGVAIGECELCRRQQLPDLVAVEGVSECG